MGSEAMTMKEIKISSTDKVHNLHVVIWEPELPPIGVVQISHGMIEYIKRYDHFARYLNDQGFLVIGNDHLGHGETAMTEEDFGYFCPGNMSGTVVDDLYKVTCYAKDNFPAIPYFLFGHSMGSFMARRYIIKYGEELDGAILSGTGNQPQSVLKAGTILASLIKNIKGDHHRSELLKKLFLGQFNRRIKNARTSNDWITKDEQIVDLYNQDKYCTFSFTVNGYRTLLDVLSYIQDPKHIANIPRKLPILLMSGEEDPVGNYGKAVKAVFESYRKAGVEDISIKLYKNDRHELINETDNEMVYDDVYHWLKAHLI